MWVLILALGLVAVRASFGPEKVGQVVPLSSKDFEDAVLSTPVPVIIALTEGY